MRRISLLALLGCSAFAAHQLPTRRNSNLVSSDVCVLHVDLNPPHLPSSGDGCVSQRARVALILLACFVLKHGGSGLATLRQPEATLAV